MSPNQKICRDCSLCQDNFFSLPDLPRKAKELLEGKVVCRQLKKGSILFREGEKVDAVYMIRHGRIKLTRWDSEGNEQIIGIFSENETIWEGLLLDGSTYPYSAECLTPSTVCFLYSDDFLEVLNEPVVSMSMLSLLSRKLHDANERNLVLSTKDPKARLAAFLLYREKRDREESIHMKLDDIAASLNLRPETVSRKLNELIEEGLVSRTGKSEIRIQDFEALESVRS